MEFPLHPVDACIQYKEQPDALFEVKQRMLGVGLALPVGDSHPITLVAPDQLCVPSDRDGQVGLDTLTALAGYASFVIGNEGEVNKMFAKKESGKTG